jgi:hypothetical protein
MHKPVHISNGDWDEHNALMGHEVFVATLSCGMAVVLDSTGIQFGWKEHITLWSSYKRHRVHQITDQKHLGPNSKGLGDLENGDNFKIIRLMGVVPPDLTSKDRKEQRLMETVVRSLESQINAHFGGVTAFLRLKGREECGREAEYVGGLGGGTADGVGGDFGESGEDCEGEGGAVAEGADALCVVAECAGDEEAKGKGKL